MKTAQGVLQNKPLDGKPHPNLLIINVCNDQLLILYK